MSANVIAFDTASQNRTKQPATLKPVGVERLTPKRPHVVASTMLPITRDQIVGELEAGRELAQVAKVYNVSQHLATALWVRKISKRLRAVEWRVAA